MATSQRNTSQHCWPSICKLRPNDHNIWTQHIAALLGAACCPRLATLLQHVRSWNWTSAHAQAQHGQTSTTPSNIHECWKMKNLTIFKFETTTPNMSQHGGQTHPTCCTQQCCIEMLRSCGRGFKEQYHSHLHTRTRILIGSACFIKI